MVAAAMAADSRLVFDKRDKSNRLIAGLSLSPID